MKKVNCMNSTTEESTYKVGRALGRCLKEELREFSDYI